MITLSALQETDREQFIKDNQEAFNYGALEEFGMRDNHFEEDEQIISRETIEKSIDGGEAYRIMEDGKPVGGVIIKVDGDKGDLDILFTSPKAHSKGIGYAAWCPLLNPDGRGGRFLSRVCRRSGFPEVRAAPLSGRLHPEWSFHFLSWPFPSRCVVACFVFCF